MPYTGPVRQKTGRSFPWDLAVIVVIATAVVVWIVLGAGK